MKYKLVIVLGVSLFLVGCGNTENYSQLNSKIESIQKNYDELVSEYNKLNRDGDDNNVLNKQYDELLEKYNELKIIVDNVNNNFTSKNGKYDELLKKYNALNTAIEDLKNKNTNLSEKYNALKDYLDNKSVHIVIMNSDSGAINYNYNIGHVGGDKKKVLSFAVENGKKYGDYFYLYPFTNMQYKLFKGWYTEKNGQGTKVDKDDIINLQDDLILYDYTVEGIYIDIEDSNNNLYSFEVEKNISIKNLITNYLDGEIEGIYTDSTLKNKYNENDILVTDVSIYINYK